MITLPPHDVEEFWASLARMCCCIAYIAHLWATIIHFLLQMLWFPTVWRSVDTVDGRELVGLRMW